MGPSIPKKKKKMFRLRSIKKNPAYLLSSVENNTIFITSSKIYTKRFLDKYVFYHRITTVYIDVLTEAMEWRWETMNLIWAVRGMNKCSAIGKLYARFATVQFSRCEFAI